MTDINIKYDNRSISVVINGQEMDNVRNVEIILPVYASPIVKIGQLVSIEETFEQSIITVLKEVNTVTVEGKCGT